MKLEEEIGLGWGVPSADASRENMSHRRKLADLFLTNATLPSGGGAFVSFEAEVARKATESLSPACSALSTVVRLFELRAKFCDVAYRLLRERVLLQDPRIQRRIGRRRGSTSKRHWRLDSPGVLKSIQHSVQLTAG